LAKSRYLANIFLSISSFFYDIIKKMKIERLVLGPLFTNCYIISKENKAIIIDPADEPEKIFSALPTINLIGAIITHAHPDHLKALPYLKNEFPKAKILLHQKDFKIFKKFLSFPKVDGFLKEGKFSISGFEFSIIWTPGHTPGSICLLLENYLFSGDTLFADALGRTDFPYSNKKDILKSLKKIATLPKELLVYPGHGKPFTLGQVHGWLLRLLEGS